MTGIAQSAPQNAQVDTSISNRSLLLLALVVVIAIGTFLRFYDLGGESLWFDEMVMLNVVSDPEILQEDIITGRPPLMVLLGAVSIQIFGTSDAALRIIPALAGSLSLVAMFFVGRELFDDRVGLLATLFLAVSGFHIYHSQDFRYYAIQLLFMLLSYLFFARAMRDNRNINWFLVVVFNVLAYYSHIYAVFLFVGQGLFFLTQWFRKPQHRLKWFISQVAIVLLILPNFYIFFTRVLNNPSEPGSNWIPPVTLSEPIASLVKFLFFDFSYFRLVPLLTAAAVLVFGTIVFIVQRGNRWPKAFRGLGGEVRHWVRDENSSLLMTVFWLVFPILLPFVYSIVLSPVYLHRYVIGAMPAMFLLMAVVLLTIRHIIPVVVTAGALLVVIIPGLVNFYRMDVKEQWGDSAAFVEINEQEGDVIAFALADRTPRLQKNVEDIFDRYYDGELPRCYFALPNLEDAAAMADFNDCIADYDRIFVVTIAYHTNEPERREAIQNYLGELPERSRALTEQDVLYGTAVYVFEDEPREEVVHAR